jgi:hypothetical protein
MKKLYKYFVLALIFLSVATESCAYHKDCGGRRKKKVKTAMGGYM